MSFNSNILDVFIIIKLWERSVRFMTEYFFPAVVKLLFSVAGLPTLTTL